MHRIAAQEVAKYAIIGVGRQASDHIAWVDVFYGNVDSFCIEKRYDRIFKINADIIELYVARGIPFGVCIFKEFLTCAFSDNNDRMSSARKPLFQR